MNTNTLENTDITLRCSNNGNQLGNLKWAQTNPRITGSMSINNGMCSVVGSISDASKYSFDCTDGTIYLLTLKKITQDINGKIWTCGGFGTNALSNEVIIYVIVPVKSLTITPYKQPFTVSEKENVSMQCTTSPCRPEPKFFWYKSKNENVIILSQFIDVDATAPTIQTYTKSFDITMTRDLNGWYLFCAAGNHDSSLVLSEKILLNITFPPDGPPTINNIKNGSEVKVLQNDLVQLQCSVTGGNPLPRLEWNMLNGLQPSTQGNTITKNISWQASERNPVELKCWSYHPEKDDSVFVTVNIVYPPDTPEIKIKAVSGKLIPLHNLLNVIKGRPFTLNCYARSNPPVSSWKWNGVPSNNYSIYVGSDDQLLAKSVTCDVSNEMKTSDSRPSVIGNNFTTLDVNVLYSPKMNILINKTVIEGENLTYTCNFTVGNPSVTNITWSCQNYTWNTDLQINNVTRNQAGVYTCRVENLMISSDEFQEFGYEVGIFGLSVQYKTKVLEFIVNNNETDNITVYENHEVNISCEIEGDPLPTGDLLRRRLDYFYSTQAEEVLDYQTIRNSTNLRLTHNFLAMCTHTGKLECRAKNEFHTGEMSTSNERIALFVNCTPRKSPLFIIYDTVISPTSVDVTLSFTALAYPILPTSGYIWTGNIETTNTWVNITASGHKTIITTLGLQSNLTIKDVSEFDYGMYRIFIVNDVGQYNHTFNLLPVAYTQEDTSAPQANASLIVNGAAGTAGGVVAVVAVIVVILLMYRKRRGLAKSNRTRSSQYYNLRDPKDTGCNTSNVYEGLQNIDTGCNTSNVYEGLQNIDTGCNTSNVYEGLQNIDTGCNTSNLYEGLQYIVTDHEYKDLATLSGQVEKGKHDVYENLQLNRITK